ncbi:MAG: NADP-dependent oxidoreductase [Vulcanimicrobiota bacterium]
MRQPMQKTMQAIALDRFGGPGMLTLHTLPVPEIGPDEVLIRVQIAGVGVWDSFEREGGYAEMLGLTSRFPYVPGSEGAGTVAATGAEVSRFREGDLVYAVGFLNPRGGFYAEYVAVNADYVSFIPGSLTTEQAGGMAGVGLTALRGLDDVLGLRPGESLLIFGASGGIGHMAVQIARRMGARVLAVASGSDGVELVRKLGADAAVDGRSDDILGAARTFAPEGLDTALLTAGGEAAEKSLMAVRDGGRVAYPGGIHPEPQARPDIRLISYNGEPDRDIIERLNRLIESGSFEANIACIFPLAQAAEAHRALETHYLGKLVLQVS